jgi:NADPH-dependent 2,4-dienoyl-CoA reductase/sulfur reductase-like enzyme
MVSGGAHALYVRSSSGPPVRQAALSLASRADDAAAPRACARDGCYAKGERAMTERSVLIIGAGIGGLSTGCYARMNGYRATILEMHDVPGGVCTSWKRHG